MLQMRIERCGVAMVKKEEYPALKEEMRKKKKMLPLQYLGEEKAKEIEAELEQQAKEEQKAGVKFDPYRLAGFEPTVIDFLRRCDTDEQALEIITYLEQKGDLTNIQAQKLREQLKKEGLRSFGTKKEPGYYFHVVHNE